MVWAETGHWLVHVLLHDQTNDAFFGQAAPVLPFVRNLCVSRVGCGGCCQNPPASFRLPLVLATVPNRRAESIAPLPFVRNDSSRRDQRQYCRQIKYGSEKIGPARDLFGVLVACDENSNEVYELVNILQWLTVKQDGLALLTWNKCWHHLIFVALMRMPIAATGWFTAWSRPWISL